MAYYLPWLSNGTPQGSSDLSIAAAAMSANTWADFSMPNLAIATFFAESTAGAKTFLNGNLPKMTWYAANKEINIVGASHTGGLTVVGAGGLSTWTDSNNTWVRETYDWNSEIQGHGYYHNAVNVLNGDLYLRKYNSAGILRRTRGSSGDSWTTFSTIGANYANQVAGALEWFPELNSGSGGLVFVDVGGANFSNAALTSWSAATGASPTGIGSIHNFTAYSNNRVYFGGGNGSLKMWSLNSSGVAQVEADTPITCGAGTSFGQGAVFPHPNGTGLLAFGPNTGNDFYSYNGSSWTNLGAHSIGVADGIWAGVTIPDYGIVLFLKNAGGTGTPTCKLYKA